MDKEIKVYECFITQDTEGVRIISFVEDPAIGENWVALNSQENKSNKIVKLSLNDEKRIVTGAVLIPNQKIYRFDDKTNEEFYIFYSEETVRQVAQDFAKKQNNIGTNINHISHSKNDEVYAFESWIVEDPETDKSKLLGMSLPKGTWMVSYKVESNKLWDMIKSQEVKGFSLEGFFSLEETSIETNFKKNNNKKVYKNMLGILKSLKALLSEIKLESYMLKDGVEIIVNEDQTVTNVNGEVVVDGEYVLEDGKILVVTDGKLIEVKEEVAEEVAQEETPITEETPEATEAQPVVVESIDGDITMILNGEKAVIVEEGQITENVPAEGEYVLEDGVVISIDSEGSYATISSEELLKSLWSLKKEIENHKETYNKMKKEYTEFKKGFGGVEKETKLSTDVEKINKGNKNTDDLTNKLNKLSGFIKRK
jgi:hypothetical protein